MATLSLNCNMFYVRTVHVSGISYRIYADFCRRVAIRKDLVLKNYWHCAWSSKRKGIWCKKRHNYFSCLCEVAFT